MPRIWDKGGNSHPRTSGKPSVEKRLEAGRRQGAATGQRPGPRRPSPAATSSCSPPPWPAPTAASTCPSWSRAASRFNSTFGACPECHGLGSLYDFDPAKVITDWSKPLLDGGLGPGSASQYLLRLIHLAADRYKIDLKTPFEELPVKQQHILVYGPPKGEAPRTGFHGILAFLRDSIEEARSDGYREYMMSYMSATPCPVCRGKRLRPESLAVKIGGLSIADFTALPLNRALSAAINLKFTARESLVAERIRREIVERLEFLCAVGLNYLSLDRNAATLSGGEGQRIRLATQIGSRLRGVLYVLDEPSIGLHQRDNNRLIQALEQLRDLGNTVLVVEHDEETIRHADYVLDLGPGAGRLGGNVVAEGTPAEIMACPESLTGRYLSGAVTMLQRAKPRPLTGKWLTVTGAREHNLQDITIRIPLGVMTVVTGVSGSGKSTLINDILYRSLAKTIYGSREEPGAHDALTGAEQIDKVIRIDQSPIGRTPRSNPATYTQVFSPIRDLFAMLPEARERGYKPGRFSFNVSGGRCEACQGDGQRRIEMNFMPDVYVQCEVCNGRRYNQETLAVKFHGHSIADILDLTIEDALPVLADVPQVRQKLQTLVDVGLGYVHLGQSATTLSGGEAQRMKLARELTKRQTGRTLYLLDEPTTGLHFDDVRKLLEVLHRLADLGNSVIIIEHNLDVIRNADWIHRSRPRRRRRRRPHRRRRPPRENRRHPRLLHRPVPHALLHLNATATLRPLNLDDSPCSRNRHRRQLVTNGCRQVAIQPEPRETSDARRSIVLPAPRRRPARQRNPPKSAPAARRKRAFHERLSRPAHSKNHRPTPDTILLVEESLSARTRFRPSLESTPGSRSLLLRLPEPLPALTRQTPISRLSPHFSNPSYRPVVRPPVSAFRNFGHLGLLILLGGLRHSFGAGLWLASPCTCTSSAYPTLRQAANDISLHPRQRGIFYVLTFAGMPARLSSPLAQGAYLPACSGAEPRPLQLPRSLHRRGLPLLRPRLSTGAHARTGQRAHRPNLSHARRGLAALCLRRHPCAIF